MVGFIIGIGATIAVLGFAFGMFCLGWKFAADEVQAIVSGKKKPDIYWQERGLK